MKLSALNEIVKVAERDLAPGSETMLLGMYNEDIRKLTGQCGICAKDDAVDVPHDNAQWWVRAYERVCANPSILDAGDNTDLDLSTLGD